MTSRRPGWAVVLACLSLFPTSGALPARQAAAASKLKIVVLQGEGTIHRVDQRASREIAIRLEDDSGRAVAGAVVVFQLPGVGAGGTFSDDSTLLTVITGENGEAKALLRPNSALGKFQVRVTASHEDESASAVIGQANEAAPPALPSRVPAPVAKKKGGSGKWIALLAVAGGAGGALAAIGGGKTPPPSSPPSPSPPLPTTPSVRIGSGTVGAP